MSAVFVHVSDIHFGQERDDAIHIHNDVKEQLISDAAEVIAVFFFFLRPKDREASWLLATSHIPGPGFSMRLPVSGWIDWLPT